MKNSLLTHSVDIHHSKGYTRKLWKGSLAGAVTVGEVRVKIQQLQ